MDRRLHCASTDLFSPNEISPDSPPAVPPVVDSEQCRGILKGGSNEAYGRRHGLGQSLTNDTLIDLLWFQLEDILLRAEVLLIACFHFENEPFDERTAIARFRVRVRIPRLLFDFHGTGRQNGFEPCGQVTFDVIDLEGVLSAAARSIRVRFVLDDFYATSGRISFLSAFFLGEKNETTRRLFLSRAQRRRPQSSSSLNEVRLVGIELVGSDEDEKERKKTVGNESKY